MAKFISQSTEREVSAEIWCWQQHMWHWHLLLLQNNSCGRANDGRQDRNLMERVLVASDWSDVWLSSFWLVTFPSINVVNIMSDLLCVILNIDISMLIKRITGSSCDSAPDSSVDSFLYYDLADRATEWALRYAGARNHTYYRNIHNYVKNISRFCLSRQSHFRSDISFLDIQYA